MIALTWVLGTMTVSATDYTIVDMNSNVVKIGKRHLKRGATFSDKDITSIVWESDKQWIKVRNNDNERLQYFKKATFAQHMESSFLDRLTTYLTRKRGLTTREFGYPETADSDTIVWTIELKDKITFNINDISEHPGSTIYRAVWKEEGISTPLELSEDRESLYLTRDIYGQEQPKPAEFTIEMYDLSTSEEAEELGTLLVLPIR